MRFRKLTAADAAAFYELRRHALDDEPNAFGESPTEFARSTPADWAARLDSIDSFVIGAFEVDDLLGTAGFYRETREKRKHKGTIWGVYVKPEARGRGLARRMLEMALDEAHPMVELVLLQVATTQAPARNLYSSLGFRPIGVEPRALFNGQAYIDEEHMYYQFSSSTAPEP